MDAALKERSNASWLADLDDPERRGPLVDELGDYLRRALARTLHSRPAVDEADLDDFVQDALVRILANLSTFRGDSRFTTWATAVALRCAFGTLRRRRHRTLSLDDLELGHGEPASGEPGPGAHTGGDEGGLLPCLRDAIHNDLTQRQREAILGELAGVPTEVLVERLNTNANALYKLHHDARKRLKRALNAAGYSDEDVRSELEDASNPR